MAVRRLVLITTCRSDYGASFWLIHDLSRDPRFELRLVVGGSHLSGRARTVEEIERDGWPIAALVPFEDDEASQRGGGEGRSAALAVSGFSEIFAREQADAVILYGDRVELLPIATAATLTRTPIAHLCGGDITRGAVDEQVRHAVTKLAHVHFPSSERSAARVRQMGEEAWRVHAVGDPSLDQFRRGTRASLAELTTFLGFEPGPTTLLVTLHPTTLDPRATEAEVAAVDAVVRSYPGPVVITAPAPDPGAEVIHERFTTLARERPATVFVESLGSKRYRGLMATVGAMLGNSSSGLSEAPCVPLPVVNIGRRQEGRDRAANVLDVVADAAQISEALDRALSPSFRANLAGLTSPYGDGATSRKVVEVLATMPGRQALLDKRFVEGASPPTSRAQAPRRHAVGGDWALADGGLELDGASTLFATGRDALLAIALGRTERTWLVPEFICPVVPEILLRAGKTVLAYPWIDPWRHEADALASLLRGAEAVVAPYYLGHPPHDALWDQLTRAGVLVVEDRCQCVGQAPVPGELRGHYAFGSFRKWLGTPDGAFAVGRDGPLAPPVGAPLAFDMLQLRLAAGLARRVRESGDDADAALEGASVALFRAGEQAAGDPGVPRRASGICDEVLHRTDVPTIVRRRVENQRYVASRLATSTTVRLLEPSPGAFAASDVPLLALPVLSDRRDEMRRKLAERRIFCAVHWVDGDWSRGGAVAADWSRRTLSVPVDQRLDAGDLATIVDALG